MDHTTAVAREKQAAELAQRDAEEAKTGAETRIAELRKAGKHDEADKALAEFRKRFPDYKIPEATRERVERPVAR